ncbi:helix-turn-helix domain-containing protein [Lactobacillus taiwanensis]|uniref:helix-turn-helix domain-containing protein n=1 Tax=Lactobacillus taiwanensis TaxID=508451 RepID=UPI0025B24F06|nr:helix-turn-helix transcriptional regulator [Lactobacillus taiwanensis]
MNIGEALKQYRTSAGLTQKEFTQNILSPAHYSKIERNLHEISANDLLELLNQNKIPYSDFFSSLDQSNINVSDEKLSNQLLSAYYDRDLDKAKEIYTQINTSNDDLLKLQAQLILNTLQSGRHKFPKNKDKIIQKIFSGNHWLKDSNKISILSTFIEVLNPLDLPFFLNQIYHKYQNNLGKQTLQIQESVASFCINYLYSASQNQDIGSANKAIQLLTHLVEYPELGIDKILGYYYHCYFTNQKEQLKTIITILKKSNLSKTIDILPQ